MGYLLELIIHKELKKKCELNWKVFVLIHLMKSPWFWLNLKTDKKHIHSCIAYLFLHDKISILKFSSLGVSLKTYNPRPRVENGISQVLEPELKNIFCFWLLQVFASSWKSCMLWNLNIEGWYWLFWLLRWCIWSSSQSPYNVDVGFG